MTQSSILNEILRITADNLSKHKEFHNINTDISKILVDPISVKKIYKILNNVGEED